MPAGRPSSYTEVKAIQICAQISETTAGLRTVCEAAGIPVRTLFNWLDNPEFLQRYTRAKEIHAELLADEMQGIADENPTCFIPTKSGGYDATDRGGIDRNRLRVDTRKWSASKLLPKKYGERLDLNVSGELTLADRIAKARQNLTSE